MKKDFQEVSEEQRNYIAAKRAWGELIDRREKLRRELENVVKMRKSSLARGVGVDMTQENGLHQKIIDMDKQIEQAEAKKRNARKKWNDAQDPATRQMEVKVFKPW